jgi:hypothetical protein
VRQQRDLEADRAHRAHRARRAGHRSTRAASASAMPAAPVPRLCSARGRRAPPWLARPPRAAGQRHRLHGRWAAKVGPSGGGAASAGPCSSSAATTRPSSRPSADARPGAVARHQLRRRRHRRPALHHAAAPDRAPTASTTNW